MSVGVALLSGALQAAQEAPAGPVDHALLVGCTEYPFRTADNALRGCGNDVELVAERFRSVLGVDPARMTTLVGWPDDEAAQPSLANILGALDALIEAAEPGDRVLIYLAGHGSQQPDGADADEDDGFDEVFLPGDTGNTRRRGRRTVIENALVDDDLFRSIDAMLARGVRVCLFSDSCHSATLARGDEQRARGIRPEEFGFDTTSGARGARGGRAGAVGDKVERAGFVGLYAVQADEQALEAPIDVGSGEKRVHGVFSFSVAQALSRTGGEATFEDLLRLITASYRERGFHGITPFLQGERGAPLHATDRERRSAVFARVEEGVVRVDAGTLHGLYAGTVLRVRSADGADAVGELRVVQPTLLDAACVVVGPLPAALESGEPLPVEVASTPAGGRRLRVRAPADAAWRGRLKELDPVAGRIELVDPDAAEADWTVEPIEGAPRQWRLRPEQDPNGRRFAVGENAVAKRLLGLHRVAMLLQLPARSGLPDGLDVQIVADGAPLGADDPLRPGSDVVVRAFNGTPDGYDLWAFWIDADHGVTQVFPDPFQADSSPFLVPARKSREKAFDIQASEAGTYSIDATQGVEQFLFLAVPPGTSSLSFLETERLSPDTRGDTQGAAAELFNELAFGPGADGEYAAGLGRGTHVALRTIRSTWEPAAALAPFDGTAIELDGQAPAADADLPSPWGLGPRVQFTLEDGVCVVVDDPAAPRLALIDVDAGFPTQSEIARGLRDRSFGAEVALAFDATSGARTAFYDTDAAGGPGKSSPRFDLIRRDDDGDGVADLELVFERGAWQRRPEPGVPWLQAARIDWVSVAPADAYGAEERALAALRTLLGI